ncbi:hypothetical protein L208DRAFT_1265572 [Tricholoma matsutake]|nr:hypothetical protein L208DRAFT_1265572 [Tricholoma matsutake 945]
MWLPYVDTFLAEMISLEGCGQDHLGQCSCSDDSDTQLAEFKCVNCASRELKCWCCIVQAHANNPFHCIQHWNGTFFESISLKVLGLWLQLGHPLGTKCVNPISCPADEFVVIDMNGIHEIGLDFCACGLLSQSRTIQLLHSCLYLATVQNLKTAATFRALACFELFSYVSKVLVFEYYQSLARLTDNTGLVSIKDCYVSLKRMVREWRYLKLLKCSGRGYDPLGARATKPGECAVLCPACLQPGKNLILGWENAPEESQRVGSSLL